MDEDKKTDKVSRWLSEHAGDVAYYGTWTAIYGCSIGLFAWAIVKENQALREAKREYKEADERVRRREEDALARGAQVLPTGAGGIWIIEKDGTTSLVA